MRRSTGLILGLVALLFVAETGAAGGTLFQGGLPLFAATTTRWKETASAVGETIRELVGHIVIQVRKGVTAFTVVPEGLFVVPVPVACARRV